MTSILFPFASFVLTCAALLLLLNTNLKSLALDIPNQRSLHDKVIPRSGGLAIMGGVLLTCAFHAWLWIVPLLVLIAVSLIDDIRGLAIQWRFLIQTLVVSLFVHFLGLGLGWWIDASIVFLMVWMLNLYNFMDGADGLAGGMTFIGFATYALAACLGQDMTIFLICASAASSSLAFLLFNFNPAKIFMGDSGSIPLGFLAAAIGVYGWQHGLWEFWFPIVVFSPFIVDATLTLLKRLFKGEKIWQAHRSHYYQRLVQMGLGHRKTAIYEYCLMAFMAAFAILGLYHSAIVVSLLVCWIMVYGVIIWIIDRKWHNFSV